MTASVTNNLYTSESCVLGEWEHILSKKDNLTAKDNIQAPDLTITNMQPSF